MSSAARVGLLRSLSIRTSLLVSAGVALVVAVVAGVTGIVEAASIADRTQVLYRQALLPLSKVDDIQRLIWQARWAGVSGLTTTDKAKAAEYSALSARTLETVQTRVDEYQRMPVSGAESTAMGSFAAQWATYLELREQATALSRSGKTKEWEAFRAKQLNPAVAVAITTLEGVRTVSLEHAASAATAAGAASKRARLDIIAALAVGLVLSAGLSIAMGRSVGGRLRALRGVLTAMADGDLAEREPDPARNEIGEMSRSVHRAAGQMRTAIQTLASTSAGLSQRSQDLQQASRSLAGGTDRTAGRIASIDQAAGEVTAGVQAVASGAEEMGAAIREIAVNATQAAQVAGDAVQAANSAEQIMLKLNASSAEIDAVVKTVSAIAEQTNLLALNATIEAARAGETGKGFAVVAGEVKDLSQETAKATEEIGQRIEAIQADTRIAVEAIAGIGEVIGRINDYQHTIASAVEEQSATTNGMTNDLSRAAGGNAEISRQIAEVVSASDITLDAARATETAAHDLAEISDQLRATVTAFRY